MTYQVFFNLDEAPVSLTPDPEYYFPSKRHNEALETLIYCIESGEGFVQITGQPGVGKTLLIRSFLDQLGDNVNTALILHPGLDPEELFKVILEDLGLTPENMEAMSKESLLRSFRDILLKSADQGMQTLVIIDEAQEIPEKTLEELRLLSNLETNKAKLLQIILVGQLELEDKLNQHKFNQLRQRITNRYRLDALTLDETINYIHHRLKVAGGGTISRFDQKIIKEIHTISSGIPRIINTLCERSLMAAFVDGKSSVNRNHLHNAAQSLDYNIIETRHKRGKTGLIFFLCMALAIAATALYFSNGSFQKLVDLKNKQLTAFLQTKNFDFISPSEKQIAPPEIIQQTDLSELTIPVHSDSDQRTSVTTIETTTENTAVDLNPKQPTNKVQTAVDIPDKQSIGHREYPTIISVESSPVILPAGWRSIAIQQNGQKALFFQSNTPAPVKELTLPFTTSLEDGLYLLGQDKDTSFLFNHRSFFSWQGNSPLSRWLLQQFADDESHPVIPVIISSENSENMPDQMALSSIQTVVKSWAAAFNHKDIEELMRYYDGSLIGYQLFRSTPTVKSHAQIAAKKAKLFEKNEAVFLQISEPVCFISNTDPSRATALFYQRFISSSYGDSGIKVLYLRKTANDTVKKPEWVITGTLWLPAQDKKKESTHL